MASRFALIATIGSLIFIIAAAADSQAEMPEISPYGLFENLFPREEIDTATMGVNAFVNDARFGSIRSQLHEVKNTLKLKHIRVLFAWDDNVQPTPRSRPNFSFYDNIAKKIPRGTQALVVLTGVPSWMNDPANWTGGSPRSAFVRRWVRKV